MSSRTRRSSVTTPAATPPPPPAPASKAKKGIAASSQPSSQTIFDASQIEEASNNVELLRRLKDISQQLHETEQPSNPADVPWNPSFPKALVDRKLLSHKDTDVRLLVASCLCDVLRLSAPDHPFSNTEVRHVFALFVDVLRQLERTEDSTTYTRAFSLLERLSVVKAFALLTDPALHAEYILGNAFDTFLAVVSSKISKKAQSYMVNILTGILDEMDEITPEIIKRLLSALDSDKKIARPEAYELAKSIIVKASDRLQNPLALELNQRMQAVVKPYSSLTFGRKEDEDEEASEAGESGHGHKRRSSKSSAVSASDSNVQSGKLSLEQRQLVELICELNVISPNLLLYVLPVAISFLKTEQPEARFFATRLFSRLFEPKLPNLVESYHTQFDEDYLGRFLDIEPAVRASMCKAAPKIALNHPTMADRFQKLLKERLSDHEERVRALAAESICTICCENPSIAQVDTLNSVAERMRDRKPNVRMASLKSLVAIYTSRSSDQEQRWSQEDEDKFGWIPKQIFFMYLQPDLDPDMRIEIERMLDEEFLPASYSDVNGRYEALVRLYARLDETSVRNAFISLLRSKKNFQDFVNQFLSLRVRAKAMTRSASAASSSAAASQSEDEFSPSFASAGRSGTFASSSLFDRMPAEFNAIFGKLSMCLPDVGKGPDMWSKLLAIADENVFKSLATIARPDAKLQELAKAKTDFVQRIGSKSSIAEYMTVAANRLANSLTNIEIIGMGFESIQGAVGTDNMPTKETFNEAAAIASASGADSSAPSPHTILNESRLVLAAVSLLERTSEVFPSIFSKFLEALHELLNEEHNGLILFSLHALVHSSCDVDEIVPAISDDMLERIGKIAREGTPQSAPLAIEAMSKCFPTTSADAFSAIITEYIANLRPTNRSLEAVVNALAKLAEVSPLTFAAHEHVILPAVVQNILYKRKGSSSSWQQPTENCRVRMAVVQLIGTYIASLDHRAFAAAMNGSSSVASPTQPQQAPTIDREVVRRAQELESHLDRILEQGGELMDDDDGTGDIDKAKLRLAAGKSLLTIAPARIGELVLKPKTIHLLAALVRDEYTNIRQDFIPHFGALCASRAYSVKYLALLMLSVADDDARVASIGRRFCTFANNRLVRLISSMEHGVSLNSRQAVRICPEYALPYLIHIMAHSTYFTDQKMERAQRVLTFFFDSTTNVTATAAEHYGFFLKLLNHMKTANNAFDEESDAHRAMSDLAAMVLNAKFKKGSDIGTSFPGDTYLPEGYFDISARHANAADASHVYLPDKFTLSSKAKHGVKSSPAHTPAKTKSESKRSPSKSPAAAVAADKKEKPREKRKIAATAAKRRGKKRQQSDEEEDGFSFSDVESDEEVTPAKTAGRGGAATRIESDEEMEASEAEEEVKPAKRQAASTPASTKKKAAPAAKQQQSKQKKQKDEEEKEGDAAASDHEQEVKPSRAKRGRPVTPISTRPRRKLM